VTSLVLANIGQLVTNDETLGRGPLGIIDRAAIVVDGERVAWTGEHAALPEAAGDTAIDAAGRCVLPGFVDSHAHLVFAGDRVAEFTARAAGAPYRPGGILTTVAATRAAATAALSASAESLRREALRSGTTTMESKSGYGLTVLDEQRSCQVAGEVADAATFLGAHVVPPEYAGDTDAYVRLVTGEMLGACAPLVGFVDAFCEDGAFDADQARAVLTAGAAAGLRPKVHANQLGPGPGVQVAVEVGAVSADHCTYLSRADVDALASSTTVATLLPITELSTRSPHADGRRLVDAGVRVALASNCNPGSGFSTSMPLVIALAVLLLGLSVEEALLAATLGGARALGRDDVGRLRPGQRADLVLLDASDPAYLAYRPGLDLVGGVWRRGVRVR
jgi:imidazolonepropionase